jgi:hypothetical protein
VLGSKLQVETYSIEITCSYLRDRFRYISRLCTGSDSEFRKRERARERESEREREIEIEREREQID